MTLVAEGCTVSPRQGRGYPLLLLGVVTLYQSLNPPSHTTALSHPLLSHNRTRPAVSHPSVHSPHCGHTWAAFLSHSSSLWAQVSSLPWAGGVFSLPQLCQQRWEKEKNIYIYIITAQTHERQGCFLPSKGWKLDFYDLSRTWHGSVSTTMLQCVTLEKGRQGAGRASQQDGSHDPSHSGSSPTRLEAEPAENSCSWEHNVTKLWTNS